jgi:hypothetical protein
LYFCNVVTKSRLYQFISLYNSMLRYIKHFEVFVLCMDEDVFRILTKANFKNVHPMPLCVVENEELKHLKQTRTTSEYCWTLKPVFMHHILRQYDYVPILTYLDADMMFFSDPHYVFEKYKTASALLSRHDFSEKYKYMEADVGTFNSGFLSIRNDVQGMECIRWWEQKCLEWCGNTTVTGQFGDQKYLEEMYIRFQNVTAVEIPGVNTAPWNDAGKKATSIRGKIYIDGFPLILYHFCGFRLRSKHTCIFMFGNIYKPIIHKPYMKAVKSAIQLVDKIEPNFAGLCDEEVNINRFNIFSLD